MNYRICELESFSVIGKEIGLNMLLWKEEKTNYFIAVQYHEK